VTVTMKKRVVALYVDENRENSRVLAHRVGRCFEEAGYRVTPMNNGAALEDAALLVTIGGDGTLLRAARLAVDDGIPILGINTGRLGFLTEFDEDDPHISELPDLLERGLVIEERIALQAEYNDKTFFALNDVVVRKGGISRIVPFALCLNDEQAAHVPADGMLIATPTGSTAYFLSAGGSIISPQVEAFGIVPLLPHTLFSRPIIVPASSHIIIGCDSELAHANLECDGEVVSDLDPGASVVIVRYPRPVRFARISRLRFFERLEHKLQWGVSIKGRHDRR
jgi:NAD+ kinase